MNKRELIETLAAAGDLDRGDAEAALDAIVTVVGEALAKGDKVAIPGLGTFEVRERAARQGRNPRTGETIEIAAGKAPAFKPAAALKQVVSDS